MAQQVVITSRPVDIGDGQARALIILVEGPKPMVEQLVAHVQRNGMGLFAAQTNRIAASSAVIRR